jgi:hypothetical protein
MRDVTQLRKEVKRLELEDEKLEKEAKDKMDEAARIRRERHVRE